MMLVADRPVLPFFVLFPFLRPGMVPGPGKSVPLTSVRSHVSTPVSFRTESDDSGLIGSSDMGTTGIDSAARDG
jgi:hypothetical protein